MGFFKSLGNHFNNAFNSFTKLGDRANEGWKTLGGKAKEIIGLVKDSSRHVMDKTKGNPFLNPIHKFASSVNDGANGAENVVQQIDDGFVVGNETYNNMRNSLERHRKNNS